MSACFFWGGPGGWNAPPLRQPPRRSRPEAACACMLAAPLRESEKPESEPKEGALAIGDQLGERSMVAMSQR